jgi:hypothetical protein
LKATAATEKIDEPLYVFDCERINGFSSCTTRAAAAKAFNDWNAVCFPCAFAKITRDDWRRVHVFLTLLGMPRASAIIDFTLQRISELYAFLGIQSITIVRVPIVAINCNFGGNHFTVTGER